MQTQIEDVGAFDGVVADRQAEHEAEAFVESGLGAEGEIEVRAGEIARFDDLPEEIDAREKPAVIDGDRAELHPRDVVLDGLGGFRVVVHAVDLVAGRACVGKETEAVEAVAGAPRGGSERVAVGDRDGRRLGDRGEEIFDNVGVVFEKEVLKLIAQIAVGLVEHDGRAVVAGDVVDRDDRPAARAPGRVVVDVDRAVHTRVAEHRVERDAIERGEIALGVREILSQVRQGAPAHDQRVARVARFREIEHEELVRLRKGEPRQGSRSGENDQGACVHLSAPSEMAEFPMDRLETDGRAKFQDRLAFK